MAPFRERSPYILNERRCMSITLNSQIDTLSGPASLTGVQRLRVDQETAVRSDCWNRALAFLAAAADLLNYTDSDSPERPASIDLDLAETLLALHLVRKAELLRPTIAADRVDVFAPIAVCARPVDAQLRLAERAWDAANEVVLEVRLVQSESRGDIELVAGNRRAMDVSPSAPAVLVGLTPSEARVATAVLEGGSNRKVAEALFLSTRTVESHLSAIYRKLGLHSRAKLIAEFGGALRA
jgi:DNA-binding CsgD family transcriptional regulator